MTREQALETIRTAAIAANPEIVEPKFGCLVTNGINQWVIVDERDTVAPWVSGRAHWLDRMGYIGHRDGIKPYSQIIGRQLWLHDVLGAMANTGACDGMAIDRHGRFFNWMTNENAHEPAWNLRKSAEYQETPTLLFIADLLK